MTWKKLLDELKNLAKEDGALNEEVNILDLLDNAATVGLKGASDTYFDIIRRSSKKH